MTTLTIKIVIFLVVSIATTTTSFIFSDETCSSPLIQNGGATLTATSKLPGRGPEHAKIDSPLSWTPLTSDLHQYLQIDLGNVRNITSIATRGSRNTEYVKEFRIEFSTNLLDFSVFKELDGSDKVVMPKAYTPQKIAWTPLDSTYDQSLTVDLRKPRKLVGVATLGTVREFALSTSLDGDAFIGVKGGDGAAWELFKGNTDPETLHVNDFHTPIIAQYLRINPTRWHDRISLRLELYGCDYAPSTLYFNSTSLLSLNLTTTPLSSTRSTIRLRFKTSQPDGILLYSRGSQGDHIALQLLQNKLLLSIHLGGPSPPTTLTAGSLLDDNLWHDVIVDRFLTSLSFTVDRVEIRSTLKGDFSSLDLDRIFYVGGVPFLDAGLATAFNFTGCLENLFLNESNVIEEVRSGWDSGGYSGGSSGGVVGWVRNGTVFNCPEDSVVPVTFLDVALGGGKGNFVKLKGYEGIGSLNVTFEFRTWVDFGVLMWHKFSSTGFCKLYFEKSKLLVELQQPDTSPRLVLDNFPTSRFNDGLWHRLVFAVGTNYISLSIDEREVRTTRLLKIFTGGIYHFGGTPESPDSSLIQIDSSQSSSLLTKNALVTSAGTSAPATSTLVSTNINFVGCMRQISIDGNFQNPSDFEKPPGGGVVTDSCQMVDRCSPNPCSHSAPCTQTSTTFTCDCTSTGAYTGATCHTPLYPLSCHAYKSILLASGGPLSDFKRSVTIDADGSGPLEPFPVTCQFYHDGTVETILHHASEEAVLVDGYEGPGSFDLGIEYDAGWPEIESLLNRSLECRQWVRLDCRNARLMGSPSTPELFTPSTWWTSRQNQPMDYWGGSLIGSRKCECGIHGNCETPDKWCNCDSAITDTWLADEGWLVDKEYLPVRTVRVGDTGTVSDDKQAKVTLGPLICKGDALYATPITFRLPDASLEFALEDPSRGSSINLLAAPSWDIYFEFKTTTQNAVILHAKGPNDWVKVELINGNLLKFQVESGNGPLGVNVATTGLLSDDEWHSVGVERNRKQLRIILDSSQSSTVLQPHPTTSPTRPLYLTTPLFVGSTTERRDGYVGCLRALLVNGHPFDLASAASVNPYGVGLGCFGKCASNPCLNNGTCLEGYDKYGCDCRFTAFKGPICADEIGVNLASNNFVKYDLRGSYKSTISEKIRVGFTTTEPRGFLVGLFSNTSGEYLTLMVSNSGHLRLVFDFGFERQELIFPDQNFATGQYHDVQISRQNSGQTLVMKVDNLEPKIYNFNVKTSADAQFNSVEYLYIGKNESMREGFVGCVSRVEFDDQYPLKYYFQENRPKIVWSEPASLSEDFCGVEPVTHPPELTETRPLPKLDEEKLRRIYGSSATQSAVLGGVLALLFLLVILVCVGVGRQLSLGRGQYLTQEDEGAAGVESADAAVVGGVVGSKVEGGRREWFI